MLQTLSLDLSNSTPRKYSKRLITIHNSQLQIVHIENHFLHSSFSKYAGKIIIGWV